MQSDYLKQLLSELPDVGNRYLINMKLIQNMDPFALKSSDLDYTLSGVPPVTYPDIATYLVFTHSFYTKEQIKAFKSLEPYKYFQSGFVLKAGTKVINDFYVLVGKVKHSQRANAKPLDVWCILTKNGSVSTALCTCMAGNSEVCSYIAAIFFAADYGNKKNCNVLY